jgi:hypothetical protein
MASKIMLQEKKVASTPRLKEARIGFALQHLIQNDAFWSRVSFSDEKVFQSPPMADRPIKGL